MDVGQITDIKKKINANIGNIYILIVTILCFVVFLRVLREVFSVENYLYNLYLLTIFTFIIGIGFIIKKTPLVVLTGFVLLIYATWLYYNLFMGRILDNEAVGHYIWFIALPIGALISSSIKKNLDDIDENLDRERKNVERYSTRDIATGFRNKKEVLTDVDMAISAYTKRKNKFSILLIALQELELLKEELGVDGIAKLYSYVADILKESTEVEEEKFFLGEGEFAVVLLNTDEDGVTEKRVALKGVLKLKLETPKGLYGLGRIPFKISGVTIKDGVNSASEMYTKVKKGLEYDV